MHKYILLLIMLLSNAFAGAQRYVVMSITGQVTVESQGTAKHELRLREVLSPQSVLNIPYRAQLELLDEAARKKYVIKVPGKGYVSSMLKDRNNSAIQLTAQYLTYAKSRILGNGELTSRHYSDPATVTREVAVSRTPYEEEFLAFQQQAHKEYDDFRLQAIQTYADFVKSAWEQFGAQPPKEMPEEEEVPPMPAPEEDEQEQHLQEEHLVIIKDTVKIEISILPQPIPPLPIHEQKEEEKVRIDFTYFGTPLNVSFTQKEVISLRNVSEEAVSDVFKQFASLDYNNTIRDCLELRDQHQLSDWAYLQMLDALAKACYPSNVNEATLFMAYLYQQSGYKMRLGMTDDTIYMLYSSRHSIFKQPYYVLDGDNYFVYGGDVASLRISMASYPGEQPLSLIIDKPMLLSEDLSEPRTLKSTRYSDICLNMEVNKNLIEFYGTYPTSMINDDLMTRWAMYANAPLDLSLSTTLIEKLRAHTSGLNSFDAAERLLNWVQTAFPYEYDDVVWGGDRAFFAEESLFYPYCDCEDRAILFSRLVRELLGLKVCLVYYPGHLAAAVRFKNRPAKGDFLLVGGEPYIICDPTFIGARIGLTMPGMDNTTAKLIVLPSDAQ